MLVPLRDRLFWQILTLFAVLGGGLFWPLNCVGATVFDWDNFSGNSDFSFANNWRPNASGAPPSTGDTAVFDGQLEGSGIIDGVYNNTVNVPNGTKINDMQVFNSSGFPATVVDLDIGDLTTPGRFDLDQTSGDSLVLGDSFDDTATLNLLRGRLDTWDANIGGQTSFNVLGAESLWDSTHVVISGHTTPNTAGVGLGLRGQINTNGNLQVGDDAGSGRVVVENTGTGVTSTRWTVNGSVDIGPTFVDGSTTMDSGQVTLRTGGQMSVTGDVDIHSDGMPSTLKVQTGGSLDVGDRLDVRRGGGLELFDTDSTITVGRILIDGGGLDWTGGMLHVTEGKVAIDNLATADLGTSNLTIGSGMTLKATSTGINEGLMIGSFGTGVLTVQNGGIVETFNGLVGVYGSSDGTVNIGSGSRWSATQDIKVGVLDSSVGRLLLSGGEVEARTIILGFANTSSGTVLVDDAMLQTEEMLSIGGIVFDSSTLIPGGSGQLTVRNGGEVSVGRTLAVFGGSTATVASGGQISAGSFLNNLGGTFTHDDGVLTVGGGTFAANAGGDYSIDGPDALKLPTVKLTGGASYTSTGTLFVGHTYNGKLEIRGGSTVNTLNGRVGWLAGDSRGDVIVEGNQSQWINTSDLEIGVRNNGAMLISNGGRVENTVGAIGVVTDSAGNVVVESGGVWDNSESLYVSGRATAGGTGNLFIFDGGLVNVGQPLLDGLVKLFPTGGIHIAMGGKLEADTVELVAVASSNMGTDPGSTLQVNRLIGFGPHPVFGGNLTLGSFNGPHAGQITVGSGGSLTAENILVGGDFLTLATLAVESGGVVVTNGMALTLAGRLTGAGELVTPALENGGVVEPGSSAGTLTLDGDYAQLASGILRLEIGGEIPGLGFDTLFVTGEALLDGILDVSLIDPLGGSNIFVPKSGDSFEILTANGGLGGTRFDTQSGDLPALTGELFWEIDYGSDFVRLDVFTPFTADFDRDGDVDNDDLTQWEGDYGINGDSDANGDGDSDGGDYLIWQRQFGSGVPTVAANAAVPEPGTLLLMIIGFAALVGVPRGPGLRRESLLSEARSGPQSPGGRQF